MRRLLSASAALALALGAAFPAARAQSDTALFLLLPVGARTLGQGQATVASETGTEAVWSNPASLARQTTRETAIHHSTTLAVTGDALTFASPVRALGVMALSINLYNFGDQQITEDPNQPPVGLLLPRNVVYALTWARGLGAHANAGINYKLVQARIDCTGQCGDIGTGSGTASAFDVGAQYRFSDNVPLTLGAAIRSIGGDLSATADEPPAKLPRRVQLGASYRLRFVDRYLTDMDVRIAGEMDSAPSLEDAGFRFGSAVVYQNRVHLRAGWGTADTEASGPSVGFGITAGKLSFDIARTFEGLSADAGEPPTYFSLRYNF
ncbi:MAG: PorV/PorQ family protein [Gemmatimonadaceae bacterium]